jgi:predicted AAA+ superfamily ATPase
VLIGPRQVGKSTAAQSLADRFQGAKHFVSADGPAPPDHSWLRDHWLRARALPKPTLFVVDEVQKIRGWSEVVKELFDQDRGKSDLRVLLLGSSSLAIHRGLSESLAGRFELLRAHHWSFGEMEKRFDWSLEQYLCYGGYPGPAHLISDPARWNAYMRDSIVEPVLGRDLSLASAVSKPALFRQAFEIAMLYPAQEISYQKLVGQLQDRGSSETIKHYLELFEGAFLLRQIFRYSTRPLSTRTSSPKLIPLAPALLHTFSDPRRLAVDPEWRGRVFEAAIGAALCRHEREVFTWRDGLSEVDFVILRNRVPIAIEVKSGRRKSMDGLTRFRRKFPRSESLIVTPEIGDSLLRGESLDVFLERS